MIGRLSNIMTTESVADKVECGSQDNSPSADIFKVPDSVLVMKSGIPSPVGKESKQNEASTVNKNYEEGSDYVRKRVRYFGKISVLWNVIPSKKSRFWLYFELVIIFAFIAQITASTLYVQWIHPKVMELRLRKDGVMYSSRMIPDDYVDYEFFVKYLPT